LYTCVVVQLLILHSELSAKEAGGVVGNDEDESVLDVVTFPELVEAYADGTIEGGSDVGGGLVVNELTVDESALEREKDIPADRTGQESCLLVRRASSRFPTLVMFQEKLNVYSQLYEPSFWM